ncbi:hypothetical protein AMTRI_Chr04g184260 [Amborella trichopoda]
MDQIHGCSYEQTPMILELMPYRVMLSLDSFISKAKVDGGAMIKNFKHQVRENNYPIKRPTCHITIVLKGKNNNPLVV